MAIGWAPALFGGAFVPYGTRTLSVTSPAQVFQEPLTLPEVKEFLGIRDVDPPDPWRDMELSGMISGARYQAEVCQAKDLVIRKIDLSFDTWLTYAIELGDPLISVEAVTFKEWNGSVMTLLQNVDYIVDTAKRPGIIAPPYNRPWPFRTPWPSSAVLIQYTSGMDVADPWWSGPGALVKNGMKLLISEWFNNRLPSVVSGMAAVENYPYSIRMALTQGGRARI